MKELTDKDIAVLVGLQDKEWETNTSELRKYINNKRNDVPDLDLSKVNYRINTKFHIDNGSDELGWVDTEDGGTTESGTNAPKKIIVKDKQAIREALEYNSGKFEDDYDSMNKRVEKVDERSQKNQNMLNKTEERFEKGMIAIAVKAGLNKDDINEVKKVIDEESDTTLKDIL